MLFVMASVVMAFNACSFAELSARLPVSAGEAAYVRAGFRSNLLSLAVGFLVILSGVVSSATITVGSAGYLREFVDLSDAVMVSIVVMAVGAVAALGIMESVLLTSLFTVIETSVLLAIVAGGIGIQPILSIACRRSFRHLQISEPERWSRVPAFSPSSPLLASRIL